MNGTKPTKQPTGQRFPVQRIVQAVLALGGLGMFYYLVRQVDFGSIPTASLNSLPLFIAGILTLAFINYAFDTASWWVVSPKHGPTFWQLMSIRARCEAITNSLPGGALVGEPMKISLMLAYTSMTRAEATTSFLLSKFVLIAAQAIYVITGLAVSYSVINGVSQSIFGTEHFATLVLGAALTILALLVTLVAAMAWFQPMVRWLAPSQQNGKLYHWWNIIVAELHSIEKLIAIETKERGGRLFLGMLFAFIAWSLNGFELFLILKWLGVDVLLAQGYAIDAVSCIVRMVVFMIPIGIGGQDWAITGLISAYGYTDPVATSAQLVVVKRAREFFVIGLGLILLLAMPRPERGTRTMVMEEEQTGVESGLLPQATPAATDLTTYR